MAAGAQDFTGLERRVTSLEQRLYLIESKIGRLEQQAALTPRAAPPPAAGLDAPVVPIKLSGLYELKAARRFYARPGEVTVAFGEPVRFKADEDPAEIAWELQRRVGEL